MQQTALQATHDWLLSRGIHRQRAPYCTDVRFSAQRFLHHVTRIWNRSITQHSVAQHYWDVTFLLVRSRENFVPPYQVKRAAQVPDKPHLLKQPFCILTSYSLWSSSSLVFRSWFLTPGLNTGLLSLVPPATTQQSLPEIKTLCAFLMFATISLFASNLGNLLGEASWRPARLRPPWLKPGAPHGFGPWASGCFCLELLWFFLLFWAWFYHFNQFLNFNFVLATLISYGLKKDGTEVLTWIKIYGHSHFCSYSHGALWST